MDKKTLDYYNSPLFEDSFSDKFIYNSNVFSVNEKLSVRFLKVVIDNQWYSEKDFEELLEASYNNLIQSKLQNKLKDSLRFSFIFKEGNNFVFKKWNAENSNGFFWEKQVVPVDLLKEI